MSIVQIFASRAAAHTVPYIMGADGERAVLSTTLGAVRPTNFIRTAIAATRGRDVEVQHVVISWSKDELDAHNPADQLRAMDAATKVLRRAFGDDVRAQVALHDDSQGGCLHIHAAVINAGSDGKALSTWRDKAAAPDAPISRDKDGRVRYATTHGLLAPINDEIMRECGMSVCTPAAHKETAISRHRPDEYSWMSDLQSRIDDAVDSVDSYDDLADALTDRGVDVRVRKKDNAITSFGFTDADGKVRKARTNKLGTNYTDDALRRRIEQAQEQKGHLMAIDEKSLNSYVDAMLRSWKAAHEKGPKKGLPSMPSSGSQPGMSVSPVAMPEKPLSRLEQAQRQHDTISRRWARTRVPASSPASMSDADSARVTAVASLVYADSARTYARRAALNGDYDRAVAWNKTSFILNAQALNAQSVLDGWPDAKLDIDVRTTPYIGDGYLNKSGFGGNLLHDAMEKANTMSDADFADMCGVDMNTLYSGTADFLDWQIGNINEQIDAYDDRVAKANSIDLHTPDVSDIKETAQPQQPSL